MQLDNVTVEAIEEMHSRQLGSLHKQCHAWRDNGIVYKDAKRVHDSVVVKLIEYGINHKSALEPQGNVPDRGLYLVPPHGKLIADGRKTAIVNKARLNLTGRWVLVSGKQAFGVITVGEPESTLPDVFAERFQQHRVREKEREKWWPDRQTLYLYEIKEFEPFKGGPLAVQVPPGVHFKMGNVKLDGVAAITAPQEPQQKPQQKMRTDNILEQLSDLPEKFVWVPDFVSITGLTIYAKGREPNDVDVILRAEKSGDQFELRLPVDAGFALKLERVLKDALKVESVQYTGNQYGPNWKSLPLYHLCLVKVPKLEYRELDEAEFAKQQYKEVKGGTGSGWFGPPKGTHYGPSKGSGLAPEKVLPLNELWEDSEINLKPENKTALRELIRYLENTPIPKDKAPGFAYHMTTRDRLNGILKDGLTPQTPHWPSKQDTVSFGLSKSRALMWTRSGEKVLLSVDLSGLDVYDFRHMITGEVRTYAPIAPDRIKVVGPGTKAIEVVKEFGEVGFVERQNKAIQTLSTNALNRLLRGADASTRRQAKASSDEDLDAILTRPKRRASQKTYPDENGTVEYPPMESDDLTTADKSRPSRTRCMKCDKSPVVDVHWADGRGRAWFCLKCFKGWLTTEEGDREVVRAWFLPDGTVPKKMGDDSSVQIRKLGEGLGSSKIVARLEKLLSAAKSAEATSDGKVKVQKDNVVVAASVLLADKALKDYPDENVKLCYVAQSHSRDKSSHLDLRFEYKRGSTNYLRGWTVTHQPDPGEPIPAGAGSILGVFDIVAKGECSWGAQKLWFNEWFLDGNWKGRWTFRLVQREGERFYLVETDEECKALMEQLQLTDEDLKSLPMLTKQDVLSPAEEEPQTRKGAYWILLQPLDQRPYVLGKEAVSKGWLPPATVSCLPRELRKSVPKNLQYWTMDRKDALEARCELAEHEELGGMELKGGAGSGWFGPPKGSHVAEKPVKAGWQLTSEAFGKQSGYWRGRYGEGSNYAATSPEEADLYRERALIEAGRHHMEKLGVVEPVLYEPEKEIDLLGMGPYTTPTSLAIELRDRGVAIPEMERPYGFEKFAEKLGYKPYQTSERVETWRLFENPEVLKRTRAAGFDAVRFMDRERGKQHEAVFLLKGKLPSHRDLVRQALNAGKKVPSEVLAEYPDLKPGKSKAVSILPDTDLIELHALARDAGAVEAVKAIEDELIERERDNSG